MVNPIQKTFSYHQQIGQVGSVARPSAPFDLDRGVAAVDGIKPGMGVYDGGAGFILPVDAATRALVTHVVSFNKSAVPTDISVPAGNNLTEVVFNTGDVMPLIALGSAFVIAGEAVANGDAAIFNETTGKWIKYAPAASTPNDLRKKAFSFYLPPGASAGDGDIVEIRVPGLVYSFDALNDLDVITSKVSLTAAEIKALRATPAELVAAPGADKLIEFVSAVLVLTAGSEVLTESADNMAIEYDDGSAVAVTGAIEATGFIDQAADTITRAIPAADTIDALADVVNKNLALVNTGDGEYAGNASDDAALDIYISYRILSLA